LEATYRLTGSVTWPAYVLPQLCIILSFGFIFRLGCDLMEGARALAATLLLTGIYFYSWPSPELNHNVVQLPLWSGLLLCLWRAPQATSNKIAAFWWIAGALFAAGLTYAKYSAALLILTAAVWLLADPTSRRALLSSPWPWVAVLVFLAVAAPGLVWLSQNYHGPLSYAANRSSSASAVGVPSFLALQLACHGGMLIMMLIAGLIGWRRDPNDLPLVSAPISRRGWMFLLWFGITPLLLIVAGAITFSVGLRGAWGSPLSLMSGLLAVALASDRFNHQALVRLAATAMVVLPVIAGVYATTIIVGPSINRRPGPVNWPQAEISARMLANWRRATDAPLRIVIGDSVAGGLTALTAPGRPSLVIDSDFSITPYVTQQRIAAEGALVVWRTRSAADLAKGRSAPDFGPSYPVSRETFVWPRRTKAEPLQLDYIIMLPKAATGVLPVPPAPASSGVAVPQRVP
jgi:4-amino-4-deoxy-L-arabinose transferase-like glycosyltransferase